MDSLHARKKLFDTANLFKKIYIIKGNSNLQHFWRRTEQYLSEKKKIIKKLAKLLRKQVENEEKTSLIAHVIQNVSSNAHAAIS